MASTYDALCGGGSSPCYKVVYSGSRNSKIKLGLSSTMYTLAVVHKEFVAQIDTQYTADIAVSTNLLNSVNNPDSYQNIEEWTLGSSVLQFNTFYSYSHEHKSGNTGSSKKIVYLKNDSLYIDYYVIENGVYAPVVPLDTIYYSFRGVKK